MISKKQNGTHRKNFADKQQDEYIQQLKTGIAIAINFMDERTKRLFAGSLYLGTHKILSIAKIADICKCSDATVRVKAFIVDKEYCLGLKVPDCDFAKINVTYKAPIGAQLPQESSKWNYSICSIV